jgi:hypothetical protein
MEQLRNLNKMIVDDESSVSEKKSTAKKPVQSIKPPEISSETSAFLQSINVDAKKDLGKITNTEDTSKL